MKYSKITTEKISENKWIARTILEPPLSCEVNIQARTEQEAIHKLEKILTEE